MKSKIKVLISVALLILFTSVLANAATSENEISEKVEEIEKTKENVEDKISSLNEPSFITTQWTSYLEKTSFGRFLIEVGKVLEALNPIFKLFIGIEYSVSWLFFLSLITAISVFIILYRPIKDFAGLNPIFAVIIVLCFLGLMSIKKVIPSTLQSMAPAIPNKWMIIIMIGVIAGIVAIYWIMIKRFGEAYKKMLKEEKEKQRELRDETIDKVKDIKLKGGNV